MVCIVYVCVWPYAYNPNFLALALSLMIFVSDVRLEDMFLIGGGDAVRMHGNFRPQQRYHDGVNTESQSRLALVSHIQQSIVQRYTLS